jgi:hypothetical protein
MGLGGHGKALSITDIQDYLQQRKEIGDKEKEKDEKKKDTLTTEGSKTSLRVIIY